MGKETKLTFAECLKEAIEEMKSMQNGEIPRRDWREMMRDIKESGK